jgi:hypothetical protein
MAKSQNPSSKQSLLAQVPRRGREAIARIMEERGGKATLQQFLAKRWNSEDYFRSEGLSKREAALRVADDGAEVAQQHPGWSPEKVRAALALSYLTMDLKEVAVARRFTLDDPGELGRGLSVLSRLRWLDGWIGGYTYVDFDGVVEAFAVRDLTAAERLAEGEPAVSQGPPEFLDLCSRAVAAVCGGETARLRSVTRKMVKDKLRPWQQGVCLCLTGIGDRQPVQVAEGLALLLDGMHKMRQKGELEEAINLPAQGLYRLAEWASPDLVAGFDVRQAFPWDADFHAWCQGHPHPLAGLDLTGVAPALHEAVVLLRPPAEWAR